MTDSTTEQTYYVPKPASTMERSVMFIETPANAERIIRACSLLPELITALGVIGIPFEHAVDELLNDDEIVDVRMRAADLRQILLAFTKGKATPDAS